jgi:phage host-nuclease inhibitor protein Gam
MPRNSSGVGVANPPTPPSGPAISSLDEADRTLAELGRLDALEAKASADCDRLIAQAKERCAAALVVEVDGVEVAIATRRDQLRDGLRVWADANRADLLEDGKKSRKLNHGEIGWRMQRDKLGAVPGGTIAGNATVLDQVIAHLQRACDRFKLFAAGTLRFIKIQVSFDRTALLSAHARGEVSAKELKAAGYELVAGDDEFYATPAKVDLASQPTS